MTDDLAKPKRLSRTTVACSIAVGVTLGMFGPLLGAAGTAETRPSDGGMPGYQVVLLGRGHFNRLCCAATIDGVKGLMLVDTGASHTILSDEKYGFLQADPARKLPAGMPAKTPVNGSNFPVAVTTHFRIDQVDVGALAVSLLPQRNFYDASRMGSGNEDRQYDGLIGENILRHRNAILDCTRRALYLNTDPARKVNLGPGVVAAGWTRVPMSNLGNDFTVPCTIAGHHFRLIVDTGAPFTNLNGGLLNSVGLSLTEIPMDSGIIGTQKERASYTNLEGMKIGDFVAGRIPVTTTRREASFIESFDKTKEETRLLGLLGGDFLAANHALIDVGGSALYLKAGVTKSESR